MKIFPEEVLLTGHWLMRENRVETDDVCKRISDLVSGHLTEVGRDLSGWNVLYLDPDDGRLWELTYPEAESHGGGPPQLRFLTLEEAKSRFPDAAERVPRTISER